MFRVLNAILFSCVLATSLIAADNAAPAKKPSSLLSDYRLTWDINSAAWGWNIDSTVDIEEVRKFTSSISSSEANEAGYTGRVKISGEAGGEMKAGLAIIGIPHISINGYGRMGFDKETSSYLSNTSRTELKNIGEAISLYSERVHLSKMHLSFTVTFSNLTDDDMELRCTSVPVRCGGEHYVDATPIQGKEAIIIPGGLPEGIDVMFRAELDTTKAVSLINAMQENNLEINILRGQLKVVSKDGINLISETSKKSAQTSRLDICTSDSGKSILSWRISKGNELRAKTPLKTILEEINQKYIADEDGVPLFKFDGNNISGVGILPIIGDKAILLAVSGNNTELLSDLDLSKPMQGDLTIFCLLTKNTSDNTFKKYLTSNVITGLLKLAEKNNPRVQLRLGGCYYNGYGVEQDKAKAVEWYRKAAEQGEALAQYNLGCCYARGEGVVKDEAVAVKWYRKAAEQGRADAQYSLGCCYGLGQGVTKDKAEAVKWYRKAAEQGNADAQLCLGLSYCYGEGAAKDLVEAVKWYRKAAEQGNAVAQRCLGSCYYTGDGVAKDLVEAVKWYRKAAEQGDAVAQYLLGLCYQYGDGIAKDETEAAKWYSKAAEQGFIKAKAKLEALKTAQNSIVTPPTTPPPMAPPPMAPPPTNKSTFHWPVSAREKARRISCASNLKCIGLAIKQYAMDYKDNFPQGDNAAGLNELIKQEYLTERIVYVCPSTNVNKAKEGTDMTDANCSYIYMGGFSERDSGDIPLAFDKPGNHSGYVNVLFKDGHVSGFENNNANNCVAVIQFLNSQYTYAQDVYNKLLEKATRFDR